MTLILVLLGELITDLQVAYDSWICFQQQAVLEHQTYLLFEHSVEVIEVVQLKAELQLRVTEMDLEVDSLGKGSILIFGRRYVSFLYFDVDVRIVN